MDDIVLLLKQAYESFYLGYDDRGWKHFSELIESIQTQIVSSENTVEEINALVKLINRLDEMMVLKEERNYPLIGDLLYDIYRTLTPVLNN